MNALDFAKSNAFISLKDHKPNFSSNPKCCLITPAKSQIGKSRTPLSVTYNRTLHDISKIVNRNWNILQINTEFHGVFQATPMIAFKSRKNLQEIIGVHTIGEGKVFKKSLVRLNRKSMSCSSTRPSLCFS